MFKNMVGHILSKRYAEEGEEAIQFLKSLSGSSRVSTQFEMLYTSDFNFIVS